MNFDQIKNGLWNFWKSLVDFLPLTPSDWQINWTKLANIDYYFNGTKSSFRFAPHLLIVFIACFVLGLVFVFRAWRSKERPSKKSFFKRLSWFFLSSSLLGFLFLFLRYEGAKFLNMRFWWVILLVIYLIWLTRLMDFYFRKLPKLEEEHRVMVLKQQYMPKKKRRFK